MTLSSLGVHDNNGGGCESNFLPYIFLFLFVFFHFLQNYLVKNKINLFNFIIILIMLFLNLLIKS